MKNTSYVGNGGQETFLCRHKTLLKGWNSSLFVDFGFWIRIHKTGKKGKSSK
jgi:hypothetical protein